jgi:hypothetical protein
MNSFCRQVLIALVIPTLIIVTPTVVKDSILAIGVTKVYHHGFDN